MQTTDTTQLDGLIAEAGLTMDAKHVPSEYDPNNKDPDSFQGIKWSCTFKTPRGEFSTPFTQGIGHLPESLRFGGYGARILSVALLDAINRTLRHGRVSGLSDPFDVPRGPKLTPPALHDVLGCLCSDASAIDQTFEDWASDCGYDTDSRKAERTYNACRETGLALIRILGATQFEAIREAISEAGF